MYLDGEFYITLPTELVLQQGLQVGMPFGDEELDTLTFAAQLIPAKEKAYRFLDYGDLSRRKLAEKLVQSGFSPDVAEAACNKMEEQGFLDDERLALRWARRFAESKYWGPRRILPELLQRGFSCETAREALDRLGTDWCDSIRHHLETKYRSYDLSDRKQLQKVSQGLQRYGFDFEDIRSVINEYDD